VKTKFGRIEAGLASIPLYWALAALAILALVITTKAALYVLNLVAAVLILNGAYHLILAIRNALLRVLSFGFGAARTIVFVVFPGLLRVKRT